MTAKRRKHSDPVAAAELAAMAQRAAGAGQSDLEAALLGALGRLGDGKPASWAAHETPEGARGRGLSRLLCDARVAAPPGGIFA
jgi:hypothetical protein